MEEYKIGINVDFFGRHRGICSCGQHNLWYRNPTMDKQCEKCGNEYFIKGVVEKDKRVSVPHIKVVYKNERGFKADRTNLSIIYDGYDMEIIKPNLTRTIEYDIVDKVLKVYRNKELEYDFNEYGFGGLMTKINGQFFKQVDESAFLELVSTEKTRDLYQYTKTNLSKSGWGIKARLLYGFAVLMDEKYNWLQILSNAGIPNVGRFASGYNNRINTRETTPHKILGVPKFMMSYIREDISIDSYTLKSISDSMKIIDPNKIREIISIVKDEGTIKDLSNSIECILQLHRDYDYSNLKKLVLYLFRETRLYQGFQTSRDSATYLRDYVRMSKQMNLEYEKYPKSLKKEHDVVLMNYKLINQGERQTKEFKLSVGKKSYIDLMYSNKKDNFIVLAPTTPADIVKEGNQLSHCVASYVKDVIGDKCQILFLRNKEEPEKPLVTIEVRGLNIRQVRGFANRQISDQEKEFVKKWAEEKNLVEAYY